MINGQLLQELGRAEDVLATSSKLIVDLGAMLALLALFWSSLGNSVGGGCEFQTGSGFCQASAEAPKDDAVVVPDRGAVLFMKC